MTQTPHGAVASGHPLTTQAACDILSAGGNAFDATLAAMLAACITEPVLASIGGGGFCITRTAQQERTCVYDFFVSTPLRKRPENEIDFHPIIADFGTSQQEFHIGLASIATPGVIKGVFDIHRQLGRMPLREVFAPAITLAREGVVVNDLQAFIFSIVGAIFTATPEAITTFKGQNSDASIVQTGDVQRFPELADLLEVMAIEGDSLFYRGEVAQQLVNQCRTNGGLLSYDDLSNYQVVQRLPLFWKRGAYELATNPLPSSGGTLINFALQLLDAADLTQSGFGSFDHLNTLNEAMRLTNEARLKHTTAGLAPPIAAVQLQAYQATLQQRAQANRGTTHISVIDKAGNQAACTLSNGEGCGHVLPGCGFMPNNMLGEEDLNPDGFHRWLPGQRMTSMMSPSLLRDHHRGIEYALGSGGSNRIRTAILQTLVNIMSFDQPLEHAVSAPRIHQENDLLNIEPGFSQSVVEQLLQCNESHKLWDAQNLFFGGVHAVAKSAHDFSGIGDPRRDGCFRIAQ